jgi:hypothetical protein
MKSFVVHCQCPTPLAENPLTVQAEDEAKAKELFFARNGISGTVHPIEITEAQVVKAEPKKSNERSTRNNQK